MTELKPCPFCGSEASIRGDMGIPGGPNRYEVQCTECGCAGKSFIGGTHSAVSSWNTRSSWQPIDTAPKDGTKFIGMDKNGRIFNCVAENYYGPCWSTGRTLPVMNAPPDTREPTHWQPLPDPPEQE